MSSGRKPEGIDYFFGFILVLLGAILLLASFIYHAKSRELYPGQYANSPHKEWYGKQKSPQNGNLCCSQADGVDAQEDIRKGQYWTQWQDFPWMPVPWEVVIRGPNPTGHAVVWWYTQDGVPVIRCYAPGALL